MQRPLRAPAPPHARLLLLFLFRAGRPRGEPTDSSMPNSLLCTSGPPPPPRRRPAAGGSATTREPADRGERGDTREAGVETARLFNPLKVGEDF